MPAPGAQQHLEPSPAEAVRARLRRAAVSLGRQGVRTSFFSREPVFTHLPELTEVLTWVGDHGEREDVVLALPLADALGATWERLGDVVRGRAVLDAVLRAVERSGVPDQPGVAVLLRRRARLAMRAGAVEQADADLRRADAIAVALDPDLAVRVLLDRADLAMSRGDRATVDEVVPELYRRTEASGDPLLQAMGCNRSGWAEIGRPDLATARERYERAWSLVELHEDPVVEARTAAGLGLVDALTGDPEHARHSWARALELAEHLHDRSFALHCVDGVAVLLALTGEQAAAVLLSRSTTELRAAASLPREAVLHDLDLLVQRMGQSAPEARELPLLPWSETVAAARQWVTRRG